MIFLMDIDYGNGTIVSGFVDSCRKDGILSPERLKQLRQVINHTVWENFYKRGQMFGFDYLFSKRDHLYFFSKKNRDWGYIVGIDDRAQVYISKIKNISHAICASENCNSEGWEDFTNIKSLSLLDKIKTNKLKKHIQSMANNCPNDI